MGSGQRTSYLAVASTIAGGLAALAVFIVPFELPAALIPLILGPIAGIMGVTALLEKNKLRKWPAAIGIGLGLFAVAYMAVWFVISVG